MKVLVNGVGNVGTTLVHLLAKYAGVLSIDEIFVHKNQLLPWEHNDLQWIADLGVTVCRSDPESAQFVAYDDVIDDIDYVFECTAAGGGMRRKPHYQNLDNLAGVCAQGSEKGFGIPYMASVNDDRIRGEKFVHIVSCNTHGTAAVIRALGGEKLADLEWADVVVVRRSEDVGDHERLVGANVVARHRDAAVGTHHGVDVCDLFATIGVDVELTTSDVTTPSQMMHAARFCVRLDEPPDRPPQQLFGEAPYLAVTEKFDSNRVFELGRRYGFQGRIYSHAVVVANNLLVADGTIRGWMFVPQEGNTMLSTIAAFLYQTEHDRAGRVIERLREDLLREKW